MRTHTHTLRILSSKCWADWTLPRYRGREQVKTKNKTTTRSERSSLPAECPAPQTPCGHGRFSSVGVCHARAPGCPPVQHASTIIGASMGEGSGGTQDAEAALTDSADARPMPVPAQDALAEAPRGAPHMRIRASKCPAKSGRVKSAPTRATEAARGPASIAANHMRATYFSLTTARTHRDPLNAAPKKQAQATRRRHCTMW